VEVFCERRHVVIEGDDWYGPVRWTDSDGAGGALADDALVERAEMLVDGSLNPDGEFLRAAAAGVPAWPSFAVAVEAHRAADACYRSAAAGGAPSDVR
jgi:predicted dehydrogenase